LILSYLILSAHEIRTMRVSRNATNDFRTESERLAYGSRPYAISRFRGGGAAASARARIKTLISPKRLKIAQTLL